MRQSIFYESQASNYSPRAMRYKDHWISEKDNNWRVCGNKSEASHMCTRPFGHKGYHEAANSYTTAVGLWKTMTKKERLSKLKKRMWMTFNDYEELPHKRVNA